MKWFRWRRSNQIDTSADSVRAVRLRMLERVQKLLDNEMRLPLDTVRALRHVEAALTKERYSEAEVDVETVRELARHG